jgi:hypothetical protein
MRAKPLQTDDASRTSGEGTPLKRTRDLKHRVLDEVINFLGIALYLWVTFGVFAIHEWVVSAKDHIDYHFYGFALVNALVLGKVMLVAEDLHFADWLKTGRSSIRFCVKQSRSQFYFWSSTSWKK